MKLSWKGIVAVAALTLGATTLSLPVQAQGTTCGTDRTIEIAEMSWPSAAALAHIHATILGKGYGCDVKVVTGDTVPTSASMMTRGKPAIAPELWTSSIEKPWAKAMKEGKVDDLGKAITDGTVEGWFIPKYLADKHPKLKSVADWIKHPEYFPDPESPGRGRLYSCPPGWTCEIATSALFKAYGMKDKGWDLFSPGSGGALAASIARAFLKKDPIMFYYWGPTSILGKYKSVQLEMPKANKAVYECNTSEDCTNPPGITAYPSSPAIVGAAAWVKKDAPVIATYFSKVGLSNAQISKLLVYGDENKASAEDTALHFLKTEKAIWTKWVPADVAKKVEASLG